MYFVYIIKSKTNDGIYIGTTTNLERRLKEHNEGGSFHTNKYKPWSYVYTEGYFSEEDAKRREGNLKYFGKAYGQLKGRIKNSLRDA